MEAVDSVAAAVGDSVVVAASVLVVLALFSVLVVSGSVLFNRRLTGYKTPLQEVG